MAGEKPPHVKVFRCPNCGGEVQVRAPGHTITAVCLSCGGAIDVSNENLKLIGAALKAFKREPLIPIGRRGRIFGALYEVIGFISRCDGTEQYFWGEYLLFNPEKGFRWLVEFDGHWNYVIPTRGQAPEVTGDWANYLGQSYRLFHKGRSRVKYVVGEFYWRVKAGDQVRVEDYVRPPEMLSLEADHSENVWSVARYVASADIGKAFLVESLPPQAGVAPNQPSTMKNVSSPLLGAFVVLMGLCLAVQVWSLYRSRMKTAAYFRFDHVFQIENKSVVQSPSFDLDGDVDNVDIDLVSRLDNHWLETNGELVNESTQKDYPFSVGVEYWHGWDSDGSWTEGSNHNDELVSSIPAGRYHLNFQSESSPGVSAPYEIRVMRSMPSWSNFILVLILLALPPFVCALLNHSFERRRWSTSDFNPYWTGEDDD